LLRRNSLLLGLMLLGGWLRGSILRWRGLSLLLLLLLLWRLRLLLLLSPLSQLSLLHFLGLHSNVMSQLLKTLLQCRGVVVLLE
jgi:hypothetical protein